MKEPSVDNFDSLFYCLAFIVPGFIAHGTVAAFVPQKQESDSSILLKYLSLSCLNYGVWSWAIFILFRTQVITDPFHRGLAYAGLMLLAPIITGLVLVCLSKAQVVRRLLGRFGFNPVNEIPTAWDYKFSRMKDGEWLIVKLKNGKKVGGFFGVQSFAGNRDMSDIYIEHVWDVQDDKPWIKVPRTAGILISSDSIETIEFFKDEVIQNAIQQQQQ